MGAKGYRINYGGWETFVRNLIHYWKDGDYQFYIPEVVFDKDNTETVEIDGILCPQIYAPKLGSATMVIFALKSFFAAIKMVRENKLNNVVFYILGLRIGPFALAARVMTRRLGIKIIINPDGMEWKRAKWNKIIKTYFLLSEHTMYHASDYIICDSKAIEDYVLQKYTRLKAKTCFIPYGAVVKEDRVVNDALAQFYADHTLAINGYYLIVGRFVPENNYELILREFMNSLTKRDLVIICNVETNAFYNTLKENTHFDQDKRIKFVGTVYDQNLLGKIRNNAFAYIHGHSAGGTNPSLLEAMATTDLNLLYDVAFNREVGADSAVYFSPDKGSLVKVIDQVEAYTALEISDMGKQAKHIIRTKYEWNKVVSAHRDVFEELIHSSKPQ